MTPHSRKRSRKATLLLMVPAAATTLLVAGCGDDSVPAVVYRDAAECTQQHPDAAAQCQQDFEKAKAEHPQVAPKYRSREECEADFGRERCEPAPTYVSGGSSWFMPMMLGYMAGRMTSPGPAGFTSPQQRRDDDQPNTAGVRGANGFTPQPLYKSRDDANTFRTAGNEPVSRRSGAVDVSPDATRAAPAASRVVRSGGFGSTASRFAGAGS